MGMLSNIKRNGLSLVFVGLVLGSFAVIAGVFTPTEASNVHKCQGANDGRENSSNAIIRNGACTPAELLKKYNENKTGDLPAIYKHYGININDFKNAKPGVVTKSGDVKVDGKVVAKNAYTMGRTHDNRHGSKKITINGKTYWQRSDNSNQHSAEQAVMVVFDSFGRFKSAIINSCANPLIAVPTKPKPSAECKGLSAKGITRTKYEFSASASASNGAKVTGYTFDLGDGTKKKQTSPKISHEYKKAGTYTVKVTVHTNVGDKTSAKCQTKVVVKPEPVKKIEVCEVATGKIITIDEKTFDSKKHSKNLEDCKTMKVCEIETGKTITIRKPQFDSKKHSTNFDDCKTIEVCEIKTGKVITIRKTAFDSKKHSTNFDDCKELKVCEIETGNIVTIRKSAFDSKKHSTNFDDCKTIKVCEIETGTIIEIRKTAFDEKKHSTNFDDCKDMQVCEVETGKIVTIRKSEFDEAKHSTNFDDCKTIEVCEVESGKTIEIRKSEFDEAKHSTNPADCETIEVCEVETGEMIEIRKSEFDEAKHSTDASDCEEAPVEQPPVELPETGVADTFMQLLGLSAVTASVLYYAASAARR